MANYLPTIVKEWKLSIQTFIDDINDLKDKEFFRPTGTQLYTGRQGSGKTISAVYALDKIKTRYPLAIVVSNLHLNGLVPLTFGSEEELASVLRHIDPTRHYILFHDVEELALALVGVNNQMKGVVYVIDEIHLYFNALDSKNVPMYVFTEMSQQRKQRKLIICTSQRFMRVAKPLREQGDNIILCHTYFGVLTTQKAYDAQTLDIDESTGKFSESPKRTGFFIHTRKIRDLFDTYQKVISGSDQYETQQRIDINLAIKKNRLSLK